MNKKEKARELPIGTKIKFPFDTIEVVETEILKYAPCRGCVFENGECTLLSHQLLGECTRNYRTDGKNVIFKVVEDE